jgi:hypothetical protein
MPVITRSRSRDVKAWAKKGASSGKAVVISKIRPVSEKVQEEIFTCRVLRGRVILPAAQLKCGVKEEAKSESLPNTINNTNNNTNTNYTNTTNTTNNTNYNNSGEYTVDIDFDDASREWNKNKKRMGNGMYKYKCESACNTTGKPCTRFSLRESSYCMVHKNKNN